jgi:UDP-N-acetylmuramoyl-tripeptide--D-alanyl-D-alanine ligase
VPLTLLELTPQHQVAVVELGTNHPGEIAYLASIAEPNVAVVTNVGPSHLEFFGSLMEVLHEKLSLLETLPADGVAVLPGDQLDVCLEAQHYLDSRVRVVTFGSTDRCDIQALDVRRTEQGMTMRLRDHLGQWGTSLVGYHNTENALAALACTWAGGVPLSVAKKRLLSFQGVSMRSQIVHCDGLTILNDCYNANPLSVARALETLRDMTARRKVAIMGDMLELGSFAASAHQAIGRLATQMGIDAVIAVGQYADYVAQGVREARPQGAVTYRTVSDLIQHLPALLQDGDGLLIKGSRKLNLEQVTEFLLQRYRHAHEPAS